MFGTCKVENVMDSWMVRDSVGLALETTRQIVAMSVLSYSRGCYMRIFVETISL